MPSLLHGGRAARLHNARLSDDRPLNSSGRISREEALRVILETRMFQHVAIKRTADVLSATYDCWQLSH